MTDWAKLAEPFPAGDIKQRPGPGGRPLSYVDARVVAQRLDDVLTPNGWQFTWSHIPGEQIVHGRLDIGGVVREDAGYPNSEDDDKPMKAAVSDALKRCAVLFGVGRHLYDDNGSHAARPQRPAAPRPVRPTVVPDDGDLMADDDEIEALHAGAAVANDTVCLEHGIAWKGDYTDRYHANPEGGYCRSAPGNVAKPRAAGRR